MMERIFAKVFTITILFIDRMANFTEIFETRKNDSRWNTSYPLSPDDWNIYRVPEELSFSEEEELSFYIHIPFCKKLCSFCEYTRMLCPSVKLQDQYVDTLKHDIFTFMEKYPSIKLCGLDVGGGTPTALSDKSFENLMSLCSSTMSALTISDSFIPSIEATFETLTAQKVDLLTSAGFKRVSLGIQSTSSEVLSCNHRDSPDLEYMKKSISMLHNKGVCIVNLDMMYGLKGQSIDSFRKDMQTLKYLQPEQVTIYELRTNMINEQVHMSKDELYDAYSFLYHSLLDLGYHARFGQNTFSKSSNDIGVSSYLRERMMNAGSYKGFGISAQSMSRNGISYNVGKLKTSFKDLLESKTFTEEYVYHLPPKELAAKYIAIGAYNGSFSLKRLSELLGCDARTYYSGQLDFCLSRGYIEIFDDRVTVTPSGFKYYGALFSLFYST